MVRTGAWLATHALEQIGARFTFGIPGVHTTELSQIAQAQQITYNRKPCTRLGAVNFEGVALAIGAAFLRMLENNAIGETVRQAIAILQAGRPVIVDVNIDYSKRTAFTEGAVKTNFGRFPLNEKVRTLARALTRRITG